MTAHRPYPSDPWQPHDGLCNARKTDGSGLCRRFAGQTTPHPGIGQCSKHGGCTGNANVHAGRIIRARELAELLEEHKALLGDVVDPVAAVMEVVRNTWAWRRVLELRVGELLDRDGDGVGDGEVIYGPNHQGDAVPHVLVTMMERATEAHLRACRVAIDAGVAERALRIEEDKLDLMTKAVRGILVEKGVWDDPDTPEIVARHLRALPSGA